MLKQLGKIINFFESTELTFGGWSISFVTLLSLNLFFQFITYGFKNISSEYFIGEIIQAYYFILYLVVVIFLYYLTKEKISKILNFVLWGFWSIIFWPIIDKLILKNTFYLSFYLYNTPSGIWHDFLTFFGPINPVGILYGTRIETIFIMFFTGLYVFYKKKSWFWASVGAIGVYTIFFISVALPSMIIFLIKLLQGNNLFLIKTLDIVKFFNTPLQTFGLPERGFAVTFFYKISLIYNLIFIVLLFWLQKIINFTFLKALTKNIRFPQMIFNWGLLIIGILVGAYYFPENFSLTFWSVLVLINLFLSILFAWLFSVIVNDVEDKKVDQISNPNRPLTLGLIDVKHYLNYAYIFLFLSLLLSLTVSGETFLLICLYSLLTLTYSLSPFKLKSIPWVAGLISALASIIIFLNGYLLLAGDQSNDRFPWLIALYLFFSYALILPIKDLKDIQGDQENNIKTIANILGEEKARIYFAVITFLIYIGSIFMLQKRIFFIPAIIFASLNYWIITNHKNKRDTLFYKVILLFIGYLLCVAII